MSWIPLGDRAIRFARPSGTPASAIVEGARLWPGAIDVVVAAEDVAVYFQDAPTIDDTMIAALATLAAGPEQVRDVELRASYTGEDLEAIARATNLTVAEVCAIHAGATYTVETMGFAPGFAYMTGLDPRLVLPRRATPRPRVPAGSIAIAATHTAVYPFASPGGWHLLGVVGASMFGPEGALLRLGDRVRFVP